MCWSVLQCELQTTRKRRQCVAVCRSVWHSSPHGRPASTLLHPSVMSQCALSNDSRRRQCVAVCCSALQCVAVCTLERPTGDDNALQYVAVHCGALQCIAVYCSVLQCVAVCCSVLQCVAVCGSVLHCIAVCCIALHCSVLHCIAVCCSVSQTSPHRQPTSTLLRLSLHSLSLPPHHCSHPTLGVQHQRHPWNMSWSSLRHSRLRGEGGEQGGRRNGWKRFLGVLQRHWGSGR